MTTDAEGAQCVQHDEPDDEADEGGDEGVEQPPDETAQRLLPPGIERLAALAETLSTYAECDLNVARTAERLEVHANTIHYRLRRVQELTGRDPRRFARLACAPWHPRYGPQTHH